ncbi:hypothetical protein B0H10DRAFT_1947422 [Mycena sp. CBHHK59/15]|nr:hypothetical protein B0H10DRAFT_1947422 [Mycena sp. CBHHK59/15]
MSAWHKESTTLDLKPEWSAGVNSVLNSVVPAVVETPPSVLSTTHVTRAGREGTPVQMAHFRFISTHEVDPTGPWSPTIFSAFMQIERPSALHGVWSDFGDTVSWVQGDLESRSQNWSTSAGGEMVRQLPTKILLDTIEAVPGISIRRGAHWACLTGWMDTGNYPHHAERSRRTLGL